MAYCKDCGQEVGADGKFCDSCGSRLSGSVCATKEPEGSPTAELVTYPCAYCGGTGEVDVGETVPAYDTCPVCKGACEVRVPADYVECRACDGTGKEDVGDVLEVLERCGRCKGTGWAHCGAHAGSEVAYWLDERFATDGPGVRRGPET